MMWLPTGNCNLGRFSIRGHSTLVRWVGIYRRDGARGFESQAELGDQLADYILWHNEARDQSSAGQPQSGRVRLAHGIDPTVSRPLSRSRG